MKVRILVAGGLLAAVLTGCAAPAASEPPSVEPTPTATPAPIAPTASPTAPATPAATPAPALSLNDLDHNRIELAGVNATALCDPEAGQFDPDAGETTIGCSDAVAWALTAVATATSDAPLRVYVERPDCEAAPCSADALSTASVTVWTASRAYKVSLDSRVDTVIGPTPLDDDSAWPTSGGALAPAIARPSIKGSPREVAKREPYPYCGRAELGEPPEVDACFRAAVLEGRPAEMIDQVYGTEGGAILRIYRYDGAGRITMFQHDQSANGLDGTTKDAWGVVEGSMILGITPAAWDFDPWDGTDKQL